MGEIWLTIGDSYSITILSTSPPSTTVTLLPTPTTQSLAPTDLTYGYTTIISPHSTSRRTAILGGVLGTVGVIVMILLGLWAWKIYRQRSNPAPTAKDAGPAPDTLPLPKPAPILYDSQKQYITAISPKKDSPPPIPLRNPNRLSAVYTGHGNQNTIANWDVDSFITGDAYSIATSELPQPVPQISTSTQLANEYRNVINDIPVRHFPATNPPSTLYDIPGRSTPTPQDSGYGDSILHPHTIVDDRRSVAASEVWSDDESIFSQPPPQDLYTDIACYSHLNNQIIRENGNQGLNMGGYSRDMSSTVLDGRPPFCR